MESGVRSVFFNMSFSSSNLPRRLTAEISYKKRKTSTVQVLQQQSTERGENRLQCAGSQMALISNSIHFPGHHEEIKPIQGSKKSHTMGIYWLEDDCQALRFSWARSSQITVDQTSHDHPSLNIHPHILPGLQATFLLSPLLSLAE